MKQKDRDALAEKLAIQSSKMSSWNEYEKIQALVNLMNSMGVNFKEKRIPGEGEAVITEKQLMEMYKGLAREAYASKTAGDMWEGSPDGYRDWVERLFE